ncbi:serine/threonine-protein kinase haspin-like [Bombina bombina]|uniref:serine/threonine-protein kinase haspin-like n=1 Tax=Bombina bombina TaxID=8345 RepID=UPI00235ADFD4|nr:serine/threonine-protein kinase haspin-like [Bombina bombina]
MILEFEFGGNDLESMSDQIPTVAVSRNILHQVAAALAIAEEELRFEHRDLHWGNLLIEKCASKSVAYSLHGKSVNIPTSGYQVKIIDYTLSRLDKGILGPLTFLTLMSFGYIILPTSCSLLLIILESQTLRHNVESSADFRISGEKYKDSVLH